MMEITPLFLHGAFALGGGLGAVARHLITRLVTHELPISTLIVNVLGSFLLGVALGSIVGADEGLMMQEQRRLVFGFCGGFTTFSSFAYQTIDLHAKHSLFHAAANILINLGLCLAAFWLGEFLILGTHFARY